VKQEETGGEEDRRRAMIAITSYWFQDNRDFSNGKEKGKMTGE